MAELERDVQEIVNEAMVWVNRANNLMSGKHKFERDWVTEVIERLKPYAENGNVAEMYVGALQREYKEVTGWEILPNENTESD